MTTNTTAVGAAISSTPEQKTMVDIINSSTKELAKALPKHLSPERLTRIATTCIRQNPRLAQCTPASFMGSLFVCAQMGLEPVAGLAHLVPFSNSKNINGQWVKVLECQLIIGYKGIAELFYRHEKSGLIDWGVVHEKDEFSYELGTNAQLKHKPAAGERGKVIGYYCIYTLLNGLKKFNYMTHDECMEHGKKHSKTFDGSKFNAKSPWATNPDSMCLKTVMLQGSKTVPMSTELRRALDADETSREFKDGVTNALDLPVSDWQEAEAEPIEHKADTSKVAAAIAGPVDPEEAAIKAKAEAEKKRLLEGTQTPKDAPEATEAPPNEDKQPSVTGTVTSYKEPKGKAPAVFTVSDSDLELKTYDAMLEETIVGHMEKKEVIEIFYEKKLKGDWCNYFITGIAVQA